MNITDVKISKLSGEEKCKALASITIEGSFVVTGIRIIESQNGLFCAMPSRKTANGEYKDICFPITAEARKKMIDAILDKYNNTSSDSDLPF
jgi:stage V sporulation protein G